MKTFKTILLILILFVTSVYSQNKSLDLKDIILNARSYYPKTLRQLNWRPGTKSFAYIENNKLVNSYIDSGKQDTLVSLSEINAALKLNQELKHFPIIDWLNKNTFRFQSGNTLWKFDIPSKSVKALNKIKKDAENLDYTPDNKIAYTIKNNLFVAVNGKSYQVTQSKNKGIVNGQIVSRNEFGITKGTFWSPKGDYLAFYRKDESKVTHYPLVDISKRPAKVVEIKYPMAGMTSQHVTIGIYNLKTASTTWLKSDGAWDQYLTSVVWSPDEKYVYVSHLNRDQNHLRLVKYDISTGEAVKTLFEEKDDKYIQPMHGIIFVKNHPDEFIWFSKRDGWNHLYLYNTGGKLIKKLTDGDWSVTDFEGFDGEGDNIFITATKESPLERQFYEINLNSGKMNKLTNEHGVHRVIKDENGDYFLDEFSSTTIPAKIVLLNQNGKEIKSVLTSEDPLKGYNLGKTKLFKLKSEDGFDLYCRMILPSNFDSTKKYPVLVYVYGGPGIQLITDRWLAGASVWLNYMAEQGYVVFTLDNRGSANRGLKFEQVTFRNLGTHEIEDQKLGVNYLKSLPYVDSTRMGVFGWSFGGFMTTSLMVRTPGLFEVGIAGGAVIDWSYYEIMYTERYMDTPQANPEGYKKSDLLNYVGNLKGKLLMVHGTMDNVVLWQHSLMFAKKAAVLGIPLDYYPYPGWQHHVGTPDSYQLYLKITNYFKTNL